MGWCTLPGFETPPPTRPDLSWLLPVILAPAATLAPANHATARRRPSPNTKKEYPGRFLIALICTCRLKTLTISVYSIRSAQQPRPSRLELASRRLTGASLGVLAQVALTPQ